MNNIPYTITRRPVVSPGSRETPLPSNVVVDLTTWNPSVFGTGFVSERSRLPVDPTTGYVDILLNPNGTVVPTTEYSSPSSFGMNSAFYHFWLAERGDLFDPVANPSVPYLLPMVPGPGSAYLTAYPNANDPLGTRADGRTPADDALHPDRAARHQPGRDVRRDSDPAGPWSELSVPGSPAGDQGGHTMKTRTAAGTPRSAGITLTEILISILILGVGLVSLATLFPIGLLPSAKPSARRGRPTSSSRPPPTWSLGGC